MEEYSLGNIKSKRKIITEANIFRGIFCIYVLLIHCTGTPSRELIPLSFSSLVYSFINIAAKGAVPTFIFYCNCYAILFGISNYMYYVYTYEE